MKKRLMLFCMLLAFMLAAIPATLQADAVRLNLGLWVGKNTPELDERFFLDDLVEGSGFGYLDLGWSGLADYSLFPLGLEYRKAMGPGQLVIGGNLLFNTAEVDYMGISLGAIQLVTLKNYSSRDYEIYGGFQLEAAANLSVTPRGGLRIHSESFDKQSLILGGTIATSIDENPWEASARGLFLACEVKYKINGNFSALFDLLISSPILSDWGGNMEHDNLVVGVSGNNPYVRYDKANSEFKISMNRITLGAEYAINDAFRLQFGIRQEIMETSYPRYFNLPIVLSGGSNSIGPSVAEFVTDYIFYNSTIKSEKGIIFISMSYDIGI